MTLIKKKRACDENFRMDGERYRDEFGGTWPFFVTGTDENGVIDMTTEGDDYIPASVSYDGSFLICIETAAPIEVQLFSGEDFTITQAQADAYEGQWYPAKLLKVYKTGTTGTFSVGY